MTEKEFISDLKLRLHTYKAFRDKSNEYFEKYLADKQPEFFTPDDEINFRIMSICSKEQYSAAEHIINCVEEYFNQNNQ